MADDKPAAEAPAEPSKPVEEADETKPTEQSAEAPKTADAPAAPKDEKGKPIMNVKVFAPFKVYFQGEAYSISAINESGPFDVLPRHHNFLCMLVPCDLVIATPKEVETIKISRALMHVKAEKVTVYLDV